MKFNVHNERSEVFQFLHNWLQEQSLGIDCFDDQRPWGGFFVISEDQAQNFIDIFFKGLTSKSLNISGKLSPKILVVAPGKRLSWQYHHRRAEIWTLVSGKAGVITSDTDEEKNCSTLTPGNRIRLEKGERHRLVGLDEWAVIAEIWMHTDPNHPSNEEDIVRVQDDYGR